MNLFFEELTSSKTPLREGLWRQFLELGLPKLDHPAFHYVPLSTLYSTTFSSEGASSFDIKPSQLVFINGVFSQEKSVIPPSLMMLPLSIGLKKFTAFFGAKPLVSKDEKDPFVLLNGALYQEGAFLYVPPETALEEPIEIIFLETETSHSFPRIHCFVGKNGKVTFISKVVSLVEKTFIDDVVDFTLEAGALVNYFAASHLPSKVWRFSSVYASLKRDSRFNYSSQSTGSKASRQNLQASLLEENSFASLEGIWLLDHAQHHTFVTMKHLAPHCRSHQLFKGVVNGGSKSSFEGKIYVDQKAQKTEAYQLNHNLILSPGSIANSKPNLQILADDVKASHGSTCAELSNEELFYLQTRGLSKASAKTLLLTGFCREIIDKLPQNHSLYQETLSILDHYVSL